MMNPSQEYLPVVVQYNNSVNGHAVAEVVVKVLLSGGGRRQSHDSKMDDLTVRQKRASVRALQYYRKRRHGLQERQVR